MKKYLWIGFPIVVLLIIIKSVFIIDHSREVFVEDFHTKWIAYQKMYKPKCIEIKKEEIIEEPEEEPIAPEEEPNNAIESNNGVVEEPVVVSDSYTTRMTSYYPEEGETTTGSGLGINDFGVNENGWFTYQGKLVVATATTYLANQGWSVGNGVHLYRYYEELVLTIDGVDYDAIILDSCGSSMTTDRVDLFVSSVVYAKDTTINVRRK